MADDVQAAGTVSKGGDKIIAQAKERLKLAMDAYSDSRESELDDLRFYAASPDTPEWQWPQDVLSNRGAQTGSTINARPTLVMNKLPQHVKQVTNDQRQNRPAGKVIPVDDKADIEVAKIYDGMVRHIEYISDADVADDTACENQVAFGEGYFRIKTEYCDDNSFEQDIKIGRIRNSFSVYMDPTIQDPCGADAQWCFISQEMTHEQFEQEFPDATPISSLPSGVGDEGIAGWITEKTVRVAEYFYYETTHKTLGEYPPVQLILGGGAFMEDSREAQAYAAMGIKPIRTRKVPVKQVKWCKINGYEVLEEADWAGKWIPVIRVVGNEFEIEGQIYLSGLIRNAKDAQRMYNYWTSQEAEMLALAPKAPFVGYGGQFEGYEQQWKTVNVTNWPYLEANPDAADPDGKPYPLPQRAQPPMLSAGILQAKMGAADDIKGTTGQYDPTLGAESNEKSGKAIMARERQADTGTYHYVDNLGRAVRYRTRQIIDLIPKIYDTKRIARIIGLDGETDHVEIDPDQAEPMKEIRDDNGAVIRRIYNPGVGKYDVAVTTGPSYMTKRQETADMMVELSQGATDPTVALLMRYFAIKNMDFPEAQEFCAALKKLLPPNVLDEDDDSPEMAQAKQVIQGLQEQVQQLTGMIQNIGKSIEYQEAANKHMANEIGIYKAESERIKVLIAGFSAEQAAALAEKTAQEAIDNPPLESEESGFVEDSEPAHGGGQ